MNGRKLRNRLYGAALSVCLLLTMSCAVMAKEVPDETASGSVTVALSYGDEALTDGTLSIYRVGDVVEDDGNYSFALTEVFSGSGTDISDLEDGAAAQALYEYAVSEGIEAAGTVENTDGTVIFSDLSIGLYLVVQTVACDGYEALSPFLVSVPSYEDGTYVYDVSAIGKFTIVTAEVPEAEEVPEEETTPEPEEEEPEEEEPEDTTEDEPEDEEEEEEEEEETAETLPQTGQLNWPIPLLAAAGLLLLLIGQTLRGSSGEKAQDQTGDHGCAA